MRSIASRCRRAPNTKAPKPAKTTLSRNLETLKGNAIATNEAMVGLRELERDVQASRAVYESFLVRARETGEQERLDTKNIQVISRAELPMRRSSPPSNLAVALAAIILGLAAGTGIVIMRPTRDGNAVRSKRRDAPGSEPASVVDEFAPAASELLRCSRACGCTERRHFLRPGLGRRPEFAFRQ